ncbi:MAG TPA: homoserine dehydrogenase [bacterium]|nr:homoserine dehydrogenase [bacterium]
MNKDEIKIGLVGCGTVGSAFLKEIIKKKGEIKKKTGLNITLSKIYDKNKKKKSLLPEKFVSSPEDIINDPEIDIFVELIGGISPSYEYVVKAIENKKSVVTANKALISEKGKELFEKSKQANVYIGFEGSVGGAIPVINILKESFIGNKIMTVMGILNGTTNYILTKMYHEGIDYEQALKDAQKNGYAEVNPSLDIKGIDTAHKLAILTTLSFNKWIDWKKIKIEGIDKIEIEDIKFADEFGYRIKLLGISKINNSKKLELRVHPVLISKGHLLSLVDGVYNAVYFEGDMIGKSLLYGEGAGSYAAASSVISDVIGISKKIVNNNKNADILWTNREIEIQPFQELQSRYYFRFTAIDKPGVLSKISKVLGENNISISSVIQKEENPQKAVPIVMLTHKAIENDVEKAINGINKLTIIKKPTVVIRVEE